MLRFVKGMAVAMPLLAVSFAAWAGEGSELTAVGLLSTVVYGLVGILLAMVGYKVYGFIVPFSLTKELEEDQNTAVGIVVGSVIIGVSIIVAASIV